jgi:ABC-type multidrug transport system permease subunit
VFYAFEIIVANEFHGVNFPCDQFIPSGPGYNTNGNSFICNTVGAVAGQTFVSGDDYLAEAYSYYWSHAW